MQRSLAWRVVYPYLLLLILTLTLLSLVTSSLVRRAYLEKWRSDLLVETRLITEQIKDDLLNDPHNPAIAQKITRITTLTGIRITIILPDGSVVADSSSETPLLSSHFNRPEVQAALNHNPATVERYSDTLKTNMLYAALPLESNGKVTAVIRTSQPLSVLETDIRNIRNLVVGIAALTLIIAALFTIWITNQRIRPLRQLASSLQREYPGLSIPPHRIGKNDEIADLRSVFQTLTTRLNRQIQEMQVEQVKLNSVLENMTDGAMIVDAGGNILLINPAARRLFQVDETAVLNHSLTEVVRQHQVVELWKECHASRQPQSLFIETTDNQAYINVIVSSLEPGLPGGVLIVLQDQTQTRRLEIVRRDFISNVSHELRTPLASLKALTETLQQGAIDDPEVSTRFLKRMEDEIDNLIQLVGELLELSRIESWRIPLHRRAVPPLDLVRHAVERLQLQAERAGLILSTDLPASLPDIFVDAERMEQVLVNLIHNAIKFTLPGGKITVRAFQQGEEIILSVADTGVGIAPEEQLRIFERFFKSDRARSGGGTGLGLSIARHTVEAHKGRLWVESRVGVGSTFSIALSHL